jgi:hypothetical protein
MYMVWTHISTDYINIIGRANLSYYFYASFSDTIAQHSVQNTMRYSMSYTLFGLLLYVIPHIVLKYSPKGGEPPSHGLEIKISYITIHLYISLNIVVP